MSADKSPFDPSNILYTIVEKNTQVMTELSKTLESIDDSIKDVSTKCSKHEIYDEKQEIYRGVNKKIFTWILIMTIANFLMFTMGGKIGWLVDLLGKLLPGL